MGTTVHIHLNVDMKRLTNFKQDHDVIKQVDIRVTRTG